MGSTHLQFGSIGTITVDDLKVNGSEGVINVRIDADYCRHRSLLRDIVVSARDTFMRSPEISPLERSSRLVLRIDLDTIPAPYRTPELLSYYPKDLVKAIEKILLTRAEVTSDLTVQV